MKHLILVALTLLALRFPAPAFSQTPTSQSPTESASQPSADQTTGIPIAKLIEIVARKTGKKFVLDPRVPPRCN